MVTSVSVPVFATSFTCTCPLTATNSPPPKPYNPSEPECARGGRPSSILDSTKALIRGRASLRTSTTLAFSVEYGKLSFLSVICFFEVGG